MFTKHNSCSFLCHGDLYNKLNNSAAKIQLRYYDFIECHSATYPVCSITNNNNCFYTEDGEGWTIIINEHFPLTMDVILMDFNISAFNLSHTYLESDLMKHQHLKHPYSYSSFVYNKKRNVIFTF